MRYNRLMLMSPTDKTGDYWFWCNCGTICKKTLAKVKIEDIKSCGCLHKETSSINGKKNKTHGMTNTPEFFVWRAIIDYCNNPNNARYQFIGALGIKVCPEWQLDFETFYRDVGSKPSKKHVFTRKDTSKNFCKDNCEWSTKPNRIVSYQEMSGNKSKRWNGYKEITGTFWNGVEGRSIKNRRNRIVPLEITIEYAWEIFEKQNRKCALSGLDINFGKKSKEITASLDRIDSTKGYIKDNVQWVHKVVNKMKNILSDKDFINWCTLIAKYRGNL